MAYPMRRPIRPPCSGGAVAGRRCSTRSSSCSSRSILLLTASFEYIDVDDLPSTSADEFCDDLHGPDATASASTPSRRSRVLQRRQHLDGTGYLCSGSILLLVVLQGSRVGRPGKLLVGHPRACARTASTPGFVKALVRWVLWIVDGFPYFIPGLVGFIVGAHAPGPPPGRRHGRQDLRRAAAPRRARRSSVPGLTAAAGRRRLRRRVGRPAARPDRRAPPAGARPSTPAGRDGPAPLRRRPAAPRRLADPGGPPVGRGPWHLHPVGPGAGRVDAVGRGLQGLDRASPASSRQRVPHIIDPDGLPYAPERLPARTTSAPRASSPSTCGPAGWWPSSRSPRPASRRGSSRSTSAR